VPHGDAEVSRELKLEISAHRRGRRFVWKVSHRLLYSSVTLAQLGEAAADDGSLSRVVLADLGQGAAAGGQANGPDRRIRSRGRCSGGRQRTGLDRKPSASPGTVSSNRPYFIAFHWARKNRAIKVTHKRRMSILAALLGDVSAALYFARYMREIFLAYLRYGSVTSVAYCRLLHVLQIRISYLWIPLPIATFARRAECAELLLIAHHCPDCVPAHKEPVLSIVLHATGPDTGH
jgi:hypothetical protein